MRTRNPHVVVIAGPNGAGRSTAASRLLQGPLAIHEFVDADVIAQGLSDPTTIDAAIQTGRLMLQQLDALATQRATFAFETTLASRSLARWLSDLRDRGYRVDILFLWLPSAELPVARVHARVESGGHDVPDETVRRRYRSGLHNFLHIYRRIATSWRSYSTATRAGPRLIARGTGGSVQRIRDRALWALIEQGDTA